MATALFTSCTVERDRERPVCVSWVDDIGPRLAERCLDCHSVESAAGGYELETYLGAIGPGSDDVANAIARDESSRILTALDPDTGDATHRVHSDLVPDLRRWVVGCDLMHRRSNLHAAGILDPSSGDFHGSLLARQEYDFAYCAECHGEDFGGGSAESSCTSCHEEGPTDCTTCHREELAGSGSHRAHLPDGVDFDDCGACHETPSSWDRAHVASLDVRFSGFAATDPTASYDASTSTCSGIYCHGSTLDAASPPMWFGGEVECGSCHGAPPADHASDRCTQCHASALVEGMPDPRVHIDGVVQIGRNEGECTACHGSLDSPAPPSDVEGASDRTNVTVGAHRAHLAGRMFHRGPIECSECHRVPATIGEAGHIDSDWPAEVIFGSLATARGSTPSWDRTTGTCTEVYCHGGSNVGRDASPEIVRDPDWTATDLRAVVCGACHGVPPQDDVHRFAGSPTINDCARCHSRSIDEHGVFLFEAGVSQHLDGDVDVL